VDPLEKHAGRRYWWMPHTHPSVAAGDSAQLFRYPAPFCECTIRPFHTPTHTSLVISCKTRQSDNARHGDPAGIRKKQLVAFRSWDVVLFCGCDIGEISRWNDKRRDFVQISAMVRACHALPSRGALVSDFPSPLSCFWSVPGYEKKDLAKGRMMSFCGRR
jgi:hypothetical protein